MIVSKNPYVQIIYISYHISMYRGNVPLEIDIYLTIIPRAQMGSESIAHEAEGLMGY